MFILNDEILIIKQTIGNDKIPNFTKKMTLLSLRVEQYFNVYKESCRNGQ